MGNQAPACGCTSRNRSRESPASCDAVCSVWLELTSVSLVVCATFEMATRMEPVVNTVVSNVPGPQVPLYFAGARLVTFFGGAGLGDGMGLLHGVSSYVGQLILSVVSDRDMLPDPGHYADLLETSFADLTEATTSPSLRE